MVSESLHWVRPRNGAVDNGAGFDPAAGRVREFAIHRVTSVVSAADD